MKHIEIFDQAMCCSTCACASNDNSELARVAGDLERLRRAGIKVSRYDPGQDLRPFVNNPEVRRLIEEQGTPVLPIIVVDGSIVKTGGYPTSAEFDSWLNSDDPVHSSDDLKNERIRAAVRQSYGKVATSENSCCGCSSSSCCGSSSATPESVALSVGYSCEDLEAVPEGANMGLGCGNPLAIAELKPGEVVLDLGSGGGFDCFLAAARVGEAGHVIGVDMTPEMVSKARENATKGGYRNVEFRLGEIENLPLADNSVDVIISNCVINLSPDKPRVFKEAYRVLKPGGRLAIADIVSFAEIPEDLRMDLALHTQCLSGASTISEVEDMLRSAGFEEIRITPRDESRTLIQEYTPGTPIADYVVSALIEARKPFRNRQSANECGSLNRTGIGHRED